MCQKSVTSTDGRDGAQCMPCCIGNKNKWHATYMSICIYHNHSNTCIQAAAKPDNQPYRHEIIKYTCRSAILQTHATHTMIPSCLTKATRTCLQHTHKHKMCRQTTHTARSSSHTARDESDWLRKDASQTITRTQSSHSTAAHALMNSPDNSDLNTAYSHHEVSQPIRMCCCQQSKKEYPAMRH